MFLSAAKVCALKSSVNTPDDHVLPDPIAETLLDGLCEEIV